MKILKRLRNLYLLSELEYTPEKKEEVRQVLNKKHKQAIIIKNESLDDILQ